MAARFNRRLSEVLASYRFESVQDLSATLKRYVPLYSPYLPQLGLQQRTPIQAMHEWQNQHPALFKKRLQSPGA